MARAKRTERAEARRRNRAAAPDADVRRSTRTRHRQSTATRSPQPSAKARGNAPADGLHGRVPGRHPPAQRSRRPRRAALDRDPHPRAVGARSRSRWPARSRSSPPMAATSRCSCSPTSSRRRRSAACSSRASSPRGPAGSSARSSGSSRRSATPCSSWRIRRRSTRGAPPTQSQAQEVAALGVHPVAGHRGVLRGRRRLVPALPSAVEPEPGAPRAEVEREEDGRRSNPRRHDGQGKRQALIDWGAVPGLCRDDTDGQASERCVDAPMCRSTPYADCLDGKLMEAVAE